MHADYFRCTKIKHNGTNASLSDVCDSFVLFMLLGKKNISNRQLHTVLSGHCWHCSSKSNPKYPFWDWYEWWNWYEMVFFFQTGIRSKFGKKYFAWRDFFFRKKKVTQSDDEYKWWLFSMAYVIWWGWLRCWGW